MKTIGVELELDQAGLAAAMLASLLAWDIDQSGVSNGAQLYFDGDTSGDAEADQAEETAGELEEKQ